jgi:hypothetical protein
MADRKALGARPPLTVHRGSLVVRPTLTAESVRPSTQNWRKATQALACGGAAYRRTIRAAGLNAAAVGSTLTLAGVDLSVAKRLRLAELGLRAGAVVTVLSRTLKVAG